MRRRLLIKRRLQRGRLRARRTRAMAGYGNQILTNHGNKETLKELAVGAF